MKKRTFLTGLAASSLLAAPQRARALAPLPRYGQGDFRYRQVHGWGVLGSEARVQNCHGLAETADGHIILFTDHPQYQVLIYQKNGKLASKWGTQFPGAHGLSLVKEGEKEVLFLTCLTTHKVSKTTLDGEILQQWGCPDPGGKWAKPEDYKPSWTLHRPDGGWFVLDGYGKDYIAHYDAQGKLLRIFGGAEGGIVHWGPHGGLWERDTLLIAMSDQQYLLRLDEQGKELARTALPGGNPRQIRRTGQHYVVAHLGDNWPKDQNCHGFVSILDADLKVVSNIGGTPPVYDDQGQLQPMKHQEAIFGHPHDVLVDREQSLYVAQFATRNTYPLKFERV